MENDSINSHLRPSQFAAFLGVSERQGRNITAQLEAMGFKVTPGPDGIRLVPPLLAAAVKECRQAKRELSTLRLDPSMARFLARGAAGELEAFDLLLHLATETAIVREVVACMGNAMAVGATAIRPFSWRNNSVEDPRVNL